jgi:excisionase family DNA binding protein
MTRLLYDLDTTAEQLSISRRVVDRLIRDGEIDSVLLGRRRLVSHEALEDYVARLVAAS